MKKPSRFIAHGRMGHTILNIDIDFLWTLVRLSPVGDPWLRGEALEVMVNRMAKDAGRTFDDVMTEVKRILKEKEAKAKRDQELRDMVSCGGFGGNFLCIALEEEA